MLFMLLLLLLLVGRLNIYKSIMCVFVSVLFFNKVEEMKIVCDECTLDEIGG